MCSHNLGLAGAFARVYASLRCAGTAAASSQERSPPCIPNDVFLTRSKLEHDIEQFQYLADLGTLCDEFRILIPAYRQVMEELPLDAPDRRVALSEAHTAAIGHAYARLIHVRHSPRLPQALSDSWSGRDVETQYLSSKCGLAVVDNFLSEAALAELRRFCLESTVWSGNRYAYGRLGAFFHDGFNSPLLLQIAEDLRERLPNVVGDYPLRQMWGFKNGPAVPSNASIHADFAAVNVNFWITPTEANLDSGSGGLDVYEFEAPGEWDFQKYNGKADLIKAFLVRNGARVTRIDYRQNRVVIFNSDLFHGTQGLRFKSGYVNRRVNITMLYGQREDDDRHPLTRPAIRDAAQHGPLSHSWRSAAFSRLT